MEVGFYEELSNHLKETDDWEDDDFSFGFLENISTNSNCISAYTFLHGECDIFAEELNAKYGYSAYDILDEDGNLIHSFCKINADKYPLYIDIRGITDNYNKFIEEFEDQTDYDTSIDNTFVHKKLNVINESLSKTAHEFAKQLISDYSDYYNCSHILNKQKSEENQISK